MILKRALLLAASGSMLLAGPASAEDVVLSGLILDSCILALSTPGVLTTAADGTQMSSEEAGGTAATLTLVATGGAPTVTFGAPTLDAPVGDSGSTAQIKYTSLQGANQPYTSGQTTSSEGVLLDTYTVDGKVDNADGFVAGTYTVTSVATCSQ